jgi:hypothetical protein
MSIHEHLPPQARKELKEVGWTKGLELAKVARRDGQEFDCATWLHKARSLPKDQFKREVEKELTGRAIEAWEIIYFKLYKTQIPIVGQAIETADFLAGANLDSEDPTALLQSISRFFKFLPGEQRQLNSPVSVSTMAMVCCFACRSHPRIFISASFVPSLLVGYRKVYSARREADVVMSSVTGQVQIAPAQDTRRDSEPTSSKIT